MGVLWIGAAIGLVFGITFGAMLVGLIANLKRRSRTAHLIVNQRTGEIQETWQATRGKWSRIKAGGEEAIPAPPKDHRYTYKTRPCFFIDQGTGESFKIDPGEMEEPWPNAKHRALAYRDIREKNIANAPRDDNMNYAKIGAILGGIAVFMVFIVLVVLWRGVGGVV